MNDQAIRPAFSSWPVQHGRLRDLVATLTGEQLAIQPGRDRWPLWASIGHLACQRVFWLCDFAGEAGADLTPFPDASYNCPGDDDLDTVLDADALVAGLDASFRIVERVLDTWTLDGLREQIRRPDMGDDWVHTRGAVLQRVYAHDISHVTELNQALGSAGLAQVDLWG